MAGDALRGRGARGLNRSVGASGRDQTWGRGLAVRCGWVSYLLWAPESFMYKGWGVGPRNLELRLLVFADNDGSSASFVSKTQG